jgi:hypothetical protein
MPKKDSSNPPARKPGPAEEMLKLATAGASFPDISKRMKASGHSMEEIEQGFNTVLTYYRSLAEFNPEVEKGRSYARLNLLFLSSLKIQDYKTSLAVQKEINKLLSLYGDEPTDPELTTAKAIDAILDA